MQDTPVQSPFHYRRPIRWGATDAAGIVFTVHHFDICMEAIASWFLDTLELDWSAMMHSNGLGSPLHACRSGFPRSADPAQRAVGTSGCRALGQQLPDLLLSGIREHDDRRTFTGHFTCCFSEPASFTKFPIPDELRLRIEDYHRHCAD